MGINFNTLLRQLPVYSCSNKMIYWGKFLEELALNDDELKHLGLQKDVENKTEGKAEDEEWEAELARELQVFKTLGLFLMV